MASTNWEPFFHIPFQLCLQLITEIGHSRSITPWKLANAADQDILHPREPAY